MADLYTEIKSVSIFRNGAEIVRRGQAELTEGSQKLIIHGLSDSSIQDTVRLYGQEGVGCADLQFERRGADDPLPENSRAAELAEEIAELQRQADILDIQIRLWETNGNLTERVSATPEEVEGYIEKLPERIGRLQMEKRRLQKETERLEKEKEKAEKESFLPIAVTEVTVPAAGTYYFEIRCHDNAASWEPVYELSSDAAGPMTMRMRANIRQTTGEDWENVEVRLFTGNPSASETLPEMSTVFLDLRDVQPGPNLFSGMQGMSGAPMAQAGMGMMGMAAPMQAAAAMNMMTAAGAEISEGETMTEYLLPGAKDIPSGGRGVFADLKTNEIPCQYRLAAVPSSDPHVYLTAVAQTADLPLTKSAKVSIFLKGTFTGTTRLDPNAEKEQTEITLGREERIKISRRELARKTSKTLLRGQNVTEYSFEVNLANNSDRDVTVLVKDQIPVSENKDIVVEFLGGGNAPEAETGILTREIPVMKGGTADFRFSYKVSWPKDRKLQERRQQVSRMGGKPYPKFCPRCGSVLTGPVCTCGYNAG